MSTQAEYGIQSDVYEARRAAWRVSDRYEEGRHGSAELVKYTASALDSFRGAMHGANIRAGDTTIQLLVNGRLWMSDTSDEYRDHIRAIREATGRVLIHGLGLGCYLSAILTKPEVTHVDVVELSADVLALVGPYFAGDPRVNLIHGDCFKVKWPAKTRWDCVWHDIWADKCTDDLAEHSKLLRSFGKRAKWQGCWAHETLLYNRERGR